MQGFLSPSIGKGPLSCTYDPNVATRQHVTASLHCHHAAPLPWLLVLWHGAWSHSAADCYSMRTPAKLASSRSIAAESLCSMPHTAPGHLLHP